MLEKRSMRLNGHRTSLALEAKFWASVEACAKARGLSIPQFIASIDAVREQTEPSVTAVIDNSMSLASAVRVYVHDMALKMAA